MKSLKEIVYGNLRWLAGFMMALSLLSAVYFQFLAVQNQARENAEVTFAQVKQIIRENQAELTAIEAEYRETCLLNAESIAYIIQHHEAILGNVEEFRQLAQMLEVDEIHIFDDTGRIFTGTHPEYYNFTFDSGEQMNFFKPMLEDHALRLCQEITPNTAEGKLVQYSALWSADERFIVQVGMYPDAVLETTEKNELSYIFSLLQGNPGVSLYAIDAGSGTVVGSTSGAVNGRDMGEIGFFLSHINSDKKGEHITVSGVNSYCIFSRSGETILAYAISTDVLYANILPYTGALALCLLLITLVMIAVFHRFTNAYIIGSISTTNAHLRSVTEGNLEERVEVHTSLEFSELSQHINTMIQSLLSNTDKMSFVLDHTNMHIGVYEYNSHRKAVHLTEHIPKIFDLSPRETQLLTRDYRELEAFLQRLRREPVADMEHTYRFMGRSEVYVKLEEITLGNDVLGVVMDVTEETVHLKRAEAERDIDQLTGLYNRRGMERQFALLADQKERMKHAILVVIDSDDMKEVNDTYGHSVGDAYLRCTADVLRMFGRRGHLVARVGGDEFVVLLYGYESDAEAESELDRLDALRDTMALNMGEGKEIPMRFSFGAVCVEEKDYETMFLEADKLMYEAKRQRKEQQKKQG